MCLLGLLLFLAVVDYHYHSYSYFLYHLINTYYIIRGAVRLITQKKIIFFRERRYRYKISLQALALLLSRFGDAWYIINSRCDFKLHRATQVADEKENGFIKLTMDTTKMFPL